MIAHHQTAHTDQDKRRYKTRNQKIECLPHIPMRTFEIQKDKKTAEGKAAEERKASSKTESFRKTTGRNQIKNPCSDYHPEQR